MKHGMRMQSASHFPLCGRALFSPLWSTSQLNNFHQRVSRIVAKRTPKKRRAPSHASSPIKRAQSSRTPHLKLWRRHCCLCLVEFLVVCHPPPRVKMRGSGLAFLAGLVLVMASVAAASTLGPGDNNFRPKKYNMRQGGKKMLRHKINVDDYLAAPSSHYDSAAPVTFLKPPPGARQPIDRRQRSPYPQQQHKVATNNPTRQSRCEFRNIYIYIYIIFLSTFCKGGNGFLPTSCMRFFIWR